MDNQQNITVQIPTAESLAGRRSLIPAFFGLAIMFFFFTFCELSCQGQRLAKVTGIELATGTRIEQPAPQSMPFFGGAAAQTEKESRQMPPNAWAIIALAAALTGLAVFLIRHQQEALVGLCAGVAGAFALLLLQATLSADVKKEANGLMEVDFSLPYWGALLALAAAGGLSFLRWQRKPGSIRQTVGFFALIAALLVNNGLSAQPGLPFYDDFDGSNQLGPGWTALPGPQGIVEVSSDKAYSVPNAVKMGKSADGTFTTNTLDLRLSLQGYTQVEMTFRIYDYSDETQANDGIWFSDNNGASFVKVLDFKPSDWCDYQWGRFPPLDVDKLAAQAGLSLNNQFVIRFQQFDEGDFFGSPDGFYIDDVNVYVPQLSYFHLTAQNDFFDDFETGGFNQYWAWRFADATSTLAAIPTRPSNIVEVYNGIGYDSEYAVLMGKTCDDGFATNALDLHLNLADAPQVALSFWLYDYSDETQNDDGIWFSNDGGATFKKAFDFRPSDWCDYQYNLFPPLDVDELAAKIGLPLTAQFVIRFQQHDDGDFFGSPDGWYIDNVNVYVPKLTYFKVTHNEPFSDNFELGFLDNMWAWRFADQTNTLAAVPTRPSNIAAVVKGIGRESEHAVLMGKTCDDGFATNALDLHLDLAGLSQVAMTFWMYDYNDETQNDDGIWLSNDGGLTFKKAFDFRPGDWCDYQYDQFPPLDLDELAEKAGLPFTNKYVVRFQQHDDGDFFGSPDGWYLDDVSVYVDERVYAPVPFADDFETGKLGDSWAWRFADSTALPAQHVTRPSNIVAVESGIGNNSQYGVGFGKTCDDGFAANALDLYLNLSGASAVKLWFDIEDYAEETHPQDGIWFSDNGGASFTKVHGFDFSVLPDYAYVAYPAVLDVDALANAHGLDFTDRFVIRFQQYDDGDFLGSPDGFFIDNVNITSGLPTGSADLNEPLQVKIFPNPVSHSLHIGGLPPDGTSAEYRVSDVSGRIVLQGTLYRDVASIDVTSLPAGFFLLKLSKDGRTTCQKIQKL